MGMTNQKLGRTLIKRNIKRFNKVIREANDMQETFLNNPDHSRQNFTPQIARETKPLERRYEYPERKQYTSTNETPIQNIKCYACGEMGHLGRNCQKSRATVAAIAENTVTPTEMAVDSEN